MAALTRRRGRGGRWIDWGVLKTSGAFALSLAMDRAIQKSWFYSCDNAEIKPSQAPLTAFNRLYLVHLSEVQMFQVNETIDDRYIVRGVCNETGGMGSLLFVNRISNPSGLVHVLKYCKQSGEEALKRFCREVRLMKQFKGNSRVMQILYSNLDHDPPYFIMEYFPEGDLTKIVDVIRSDLVAQEAAFNQMIDCVAELHVQDVFHRDLRIKGAWVELNFGHNGRKRN